MVEESDSNGMKLEATERDYISRTLRTGQPESLTSVFRNRECNVQLL